MRMKKTKAQANQDIVARYRAEGNEWPIDMKTVASWAVRNKHWQPPRQNSIDLCAKELAESLREEYITDPQGRRVRKKHAIRSGEHRQLPLWVDIEEATPEQMEAAFSNRRTQIFTDCRQLKNDADSFNENWNTGAQIMLSFDFTEDLEESEQEVEYDGITA